MSNEDSGAAVEKLIGHVLALQARCDALEIILRSLAVSGGADVAGFDETCRIVRATCAQRRLEPIEDLSPASAARLDWRDDAGPIDAELLKKLRPRRGL